MIVLIPISCLCLSCTFAAKKLSYSDFDNYYFTKWIRSDGDFVFYVEGKGRPCSGFGYYKNEEKRYYVDTAAYLDGLYLRIIDGSIINKEYHATKILSDGSWNGDIQVDEVNSEVSYVFHPEHVEEYEIDPNNFCTTNLMNSELTIAFLYHSKSRYNAINEWILKKDGSSFSLSFHNDKTFDIIGKIHSCSGTYVAGYESIELNFQTNEVFEGIESLTLDYQYGNDTLTYSI